MDLIAIKVAAASIAGILVILQGLTMFQLYRKTGPFPLSPGSLMRWHRRQGHVLLGLFLGVGYVCVTKNVLDWSDWRPVVHALFATLTFVGLISKILIVRIFPRARKSVPAVGLALFVAALVTTGTTVPWYLYMWLARGTRSY